jgi:hypothetical protein
MSKFHLALQHNFGYSEFSAMTISQFASNEPNKVLNF